MKKKIKVKISSSQDYIQILNGLFKLTDKEILILSKFIDKEKELRSTGVDPFSAEVKKIIAEELDIEDYSILNVYMMRLKEKNAIRKADKYEINPLLKQHENEEGVEILWQTSKK